MWAAHRVDIPELLEIRKQFRAKYGKSFEEAALQNKEGVLNERVVTKLCVQPPAAYLVQTYLERICEQFQVEWTPKVKLSTNQLIEPMAAPVGYSVQVAQGTGLGAVSLEDASTGTGNNNDGIPPPAPGFPPSAPGFPPSAPGSGGGGGATASIPPPFIPIAKPYTPVPADKPSNSMGNDFDEVDIFVPGAPSAPPGSVEKSPLTAPLSPETKSDEDKKEDDHGPPGAGDPKPNSSNNTISYSNLAARFDQLKK
jgi:hypothetical protein